MKDRCLKCNGFVINEGFMAKNKITNLQKGGHMIKDNVKGKLLYILSRHIGKGRTIGMAQLYEAVFGKHCGDRINGTRIIRKLITELRREGVPICSDTSMEGGGYYLASAGGELDKYCMRLRIRALKILKMEATLRNITLPELLGQLTLNIGGRNESAGK